MRPCFMVPPDHPHGTESGTMMSEDREHRNLLLKEHRGWEEELDYAFVFFFFFYFGSAAHKIYT